LKLEAPRVSGGPITGHVIDARTQEPIKSFGYQLREGVYVDLDPTAVYRTGFWDIQVPLVNRVTDKDGAFSLPTYASGPHSLLVMAPGYAPYAGVVDAGASGVVIALQPGLRLEGVVLDAAGQPVRDAFVIRGNLEYLHMIGMLRPKEAKVLAISGADGTFRIDDIGAEQLVMSAVHADHGIVTQTVSPSASDGLTFKFPPTGGLRGVITMGGAPGSRCGVALESGPVGVAGNFQGDEVGNYRIAGLPPGRYSVRFTVEDIVNGVHAGWYKTEDVDVAAGEATSFDVEFPAAASSMKGVVTLDGQPITVVSVIQIEYPSLNIACSREVEVKPDGSFAIERLPAGDALIRFPENWEGVQFDHNEISVRIPESGVAEYDVALQSR
jgi:hypothetical protein